MRSVYYCCAFFLVFLGISTACTQQTHELLRVEPRVLHVEIDKSVLEPHLSVFFTCRNKEEYVGFYTMKIVNTNTGLTWHIRQDQLSFFKINNNGQEQYMVGTNKIVFPDGRILPGSYSISVFELNRTETTLPFSLPPQDILDTHFPVTVSIRENKAYFETNVAITSVSCLLLGVDREPFLVHRYAYHEQLDLSTILHESPDTHSVQFMFDINGRIFLSRIYAITEPTDTSEQASIHLTEPTDE